MPKYQIRNIEVDFPYEAYDLQIRYMESVIEALQQGTHALLESPTGTGKTLCLLCATLAWRQHRKNVEAHLTESTNGQDSTNEKTSVGPIIYSSRTHSQLSQALKEIKKTSYQVKTTVLGSRQQQCCNPTLKDLQGSLKTQACVKLIKTKACDWHTRLDEVSIKRLEGQASKIQDIEDLMKSAKSLGPCPYYLSRRMAEKCDIVFVPYNYLVEKQSRRGLESVFSGCGAIAIFDEAHNIEQCCSEAASFDLNLTVLANTVLELEKGKRLSSQLQSEKGSASKVLGRTKSWEVYYPRTSALINMIEALEKEIEGIQLPSSGGKAFPGGYIFTLFAKCGISDMNWTSWIDVLMDTLEILVDAASPSNKKMDQTPLQTSLNGTSCGILADAFEKAFVTKEPALNKACRVHLLREKSKAGLKTTILSYWCFSPGIAMQSFVSEFGIPNVILTSGTLSPMDSFAAELKLDFPIQLENGHIVSEKQVFVGCVPAGPTGCALDSSYNCRNDPKYKEDLGLAVLSFLKAVPGGVLMFFPSYVVLQSCMDFWKKCKSERVTIWNRMTQLKGVAVEPRNPAMFPAVIKDYRQKIQKNPKKGCILFAVCRGKVSEGIDFSDSAARGVIIAGIPYPPLAEPKIQLKREYLNGEKSRLTGSKWYTQTATRAVNQALGRVIRHRQDYGAILLCDRRFRDPGTKAQLSKWMQRYILCFHSFSHVLSMLTDFFEHASKLKEFAPPPPTAAALPPPTAAAPPPPIAAALVQQKLKVVTPTAAWKRSGSLKETEEGSEMKRQRKESSENEAEPVTVDLTQEEVTKDVKAEDLDVQETKTDDQKTGEDEKQNVQE